MQTNKKTYIVISSLILLAIIISYMKMQFQTYGPSHIYSSVFSCPQTYLGNQVESCEIRAINSKYNNYCFGFVRGSQWYVISKNVAIGYYTDWFTIKPDDVALIKDSNCIATLPSDGSEFIVYYNLKSTATTTTTTTTIKPTTTTTITTTTLPITTTIPQSTTTSTIPIPTTTSIPTTPTTTTISDEFKGCSYYMYYEKPIDEFGVVCEEIVVLGHKCYKCQKEVDIEIFAIGLVAVFTILVIVLLFLKKVKKR
jgi:hypothetical protein